MLKLNLNVLVTVMSLIAIPANCDEYKKMMIEDIDLEFFNETVFDPSTFELSVNYKPGGINTMTVISDIIQDLTEDIYVKLKVYGQAFGAYKLPTGISFDINVCQSGVGEYFFKAVFEELGWPNNCPPTKGQYRLIDYDLDSIRLPMPALPGFRVLLDIEVYVKSMSLLKVKEYLKVV